VDTRTALKSLVSACVKTFDALVFPWSCIICGLDVSETPFCDDCRDEVLAGAGAACPRCAMPLGPWQRSHKGCDECRRRRLGFDGAVALAPYTGPVRDLCLRLKQERNAWLAPWLVDLLVETRAERLPVGGPARIVPVPLHWRRKWTRGYNQSEALAERLGKRLGLEVVRPLRRSSATPPLAGISRTERARLMRGAFAVRSENQVAGRPILLVDDILTTGATCGAAARALKKAGAQQVMAVVIGRAEGRD
jgi:ComF family protein